MGKDIGPGDFVRAIYLDESATSSGDKYYLGALVVDCGALEAIESGLDRVCGMVAAQTQGFPLDSEFHGVDVFHGRGPWKKVNVALRVRASTMVARIIGASGARFFLRGVDTIALKARYTNPHPTHVLVLAQILEEIDRRLGPSQRLGRLGICHADEHHTDRDSRRNLRSFKGGSARGYTNRPIRHIGDTIYFGPSHESRLLQAVDAATYFSNRAANVTERDPRAAQAMAQIMSDLQQATERSYLWIPS